MLGLLEGYMTPTLDASFPSVVTGEKGINKRRKKLIGDYCKSSPNYKRLENMDLVPSGKKTQSKFLMEINFPSLSYKCFLIRKFIYQVFVLVDDSLLVTVPFGIS